MNTIKGATHLFAVLFILTLVLGSTANAQSDPDKEILAYFSSGIERVKAQNRAYVHSLSIENTLAQFGIQSDAVIPAFPDFDEADTLQSASDGGFFKIANMGKIFRIQVPQGTDRQQVIEALSKLPEVLFAEPNGQVSPTVIPNDQYFENQWGLHNTGQSGGTVDEDIDAPEAWNIFAGSSSSVVGIIDGGIDATHPDLLGKVSGDNGYGWSGHGIHVGGIAAANTNNTTGVSGVDWYAQLHAQRIDNGSGDQDTYQAIVDAVNYSPNVNVLNNSWQTQPQGRYSTTIRLAFAYAYKMNRVATAAMGNDYNSTTSYPAGFGHGMIAIGAMDRYGAHANFSNTGSHIDVSAPGVSIYSSYRNPDYYSASGTSMATPFVSGIASLLKGYNPNLSNDDIENIIRLSADDKGDPGWDATYGTGRVNAFNALNLTRSPYVLSQLTATGGSSVGNTDYYTMSIFGANGLADGTYVVKRYEVQKAINFPASLESYVWGRGISTNGWSIENPSMAMGWCEVVPGTKTATSATLRTYVYKVYTVLGQYLGYYPTSPGNATFGYSTLRVPMLPPVITGFTTSPSPVCPSQSGTVTCNATGDNLSYSWTINSQPGFITGVSTDGNHLYFYNASPGMIASASGGDGIEADYFKVTCTVSNAVGTVSQQYTPNVSTDCGGGGCPFVFVITDSGYTIDNNILHRSEFIENVGLDITDVYKLNVNPKKQNGKYKLQIKELNNDHSYFDRFKLYSVDHPIGTELGVTENIDLVLFVPDGVLSTNNALLNSTDVTDQIQYSPLSKGVTGIPQDFLSIDFMGSSLKSTNLFESLKLDGNSTDSVALITDPQADGFIIDPPKEMAGNVDAGASAMENGSISRQFARREKKSVVIIPLTQGPLPDSVNVTWLRDYDIRYAALTPVLYGGYAKNVLTLLSAEHSVLGNVKNKLTAIDGQYADMDSLQNIVLTFAAGGGVPVGYVRSFVLETVGRYTKPGQSSNANQSSLAKAGSSEKSLGEIPTRFELKGNYPNPFNPSTTIEYAVPIETDVTLTIYDVLGRTVGTLVNETKPAGTYQITFDASGLASGVYIYRMTAGQYTNSKKMLLIK